MMEDVQRALVALHTGMAGSLREVLITPPL
jgi:hypothetical protein